MTVGDTVAPGMDLWERVKHTPGVESLWIARRERGLSVWVIANCLSTESRYELYRRYRVWLQENRDISAQLRVMDRRGIPIEKLVSADPDVIRYQESGNVGRTRT
jgi:hypothetical protein